MLLLDLISFFPQIFWCFIFFFVFFLYFSFFVIPKIATILKFRKKKLIVLANEINQKKDGSSSLLIEYDNILKNSFCEITQLLKNVLVFGNKWVFITIYNFNTIEFTNVNQRFLNSSFFKGNMSNFFSGFYYQKPQVHKAKQYGAKV